MSEAVSSWLREQQVVVEVSGRKPEALRMLGPDDQVWQQWPIDSDDLIGQVERMTGMLGEQLPNGKHRGMLVVIDNKGEQYSAFPIVFHGRNTAASSAAQESRTLQQSTSIAIANLEQVIEIQRNEIQRMAKALEGAHEDLAELTEVINEYRTQNLEVDLMMREYEDRKANRENFTQLAVPMLGQLSNVLGPILVRRMKEKIEASESKKKGAAADEQAKPTTGASSDGPASQPDNGSSVHESVQPPRTEKPSAASGKNGHSRSGPSPRKRARPKPKKARIDNGTTQN